MDLLDAGVRSRIGMLGTGKHLFSKFESSRLSLSNHRSISPDLNQGGLMTMTKTEIPTDATPYRDQDNNPSRLQHDTAKLLATIMRLTLPCRIDKLQVLACLVSAAVGDDEPENLSEFGQRVQSISHGVVLDLDGLIDPDSAGWKARIAQATEKPDDGEPHDGKP